MSIWRIIGACFAIIFGAFYVYKAFTAERFENIGEGLNPPEEERYVRASLPMRIGVGVFALAFMLLGIWALFKTLR
jgi:hypothetical protein